MNAHPRRPFRLHARAAAVALVLGPLALQGQAQSLVNVGWADWTSGSASGAAGQVALPGGGTANVTFSGATFNVFTGALPEPYWGPASTYRGTTYNNAPPNSDLIVIAGGPGTGRMTLSFSQALTNPVLAIASLGLTNATRSVNIQTSMLFEQPFEVMSNGPNFYAGGQFTPFIAVPGTPNALYGTESSGVIRFQGTFTEISWTSPLAEINEFGSLVGTYMFTVGAAPCGEYRLDPLTANTQVRPGCTAYTRGGPFDQQFELDVRGTLRAESFFTLAGSQIVAPTGNATWQQGGLVAPAATLSVSGRLANWASLEVAGRLQTQGGSTWSSSGLVVQPMADVRVGGTATLAGANSVNGQLKVVSGGQVMTTAPLLVGGDGARLEVQNGGRLQAFAGLSANSNAQLVVGGELTVGSNLQLGGATLEVQSAGRFELAGNGNLLATVSNAGTFAVRSGDVVMGAGAFTNSGLLALSGGTLRLQAGVVMQNLAAGRVELSGSAGLGLSGALTNQGSVNAGSGSSFEMAAGSVLNAGSWQMAAGSRLSVLSGSFDNSGTLRVAGDFSHNAGGTVTNSGLMVLAPGSAMAEQVSFGQIINNGQLRLEAPAIGVPFTNYGLLRNTAQFTVEPGAQFVNEGSLFNLGTFTVNGLVSISAGTLVQSPGGRLVVNGRLSTDGGLVIDGGSVGGSGVIEGSLVLAAGASALPGNSPGTLTVTGDFELRDGARLVLEVGRSGAHDQLRVGSFVQAAGSVVAISFVDGVQPDLDQVFDVLRVTTPGAALGLDLAGLQGLPAGTRTEGYIRAVGLGSEALGLAFAPAEATRLDPAELAGALTFRVGAGEQRFADASFSAFFGRVVVEGTLGLRRTSDLPVNELLVQPGGRLLSSAESLQVVGPLSVAGEFVQRGRAVIGSGDIAVGGRWRNEGELVLGHADGGPATLRNAGHLAHVAGHWHNVAVEGAAPVIDNAAGGRVDIAAPMSGAARVINAGDWRVAAGARVQDLLSFEQAGGLLHVDGELQTTEQLLMRAGTLSGRGRIEGAVVLGAEAGFAEPGTVLLRPGAEDGIGGGSLSFADRLTVGMGTTLEFVLGADAALGRLQLLGGAAFGAGSTMRLVLAEGFMPGVEMSWTVIELGAGTSLDGFFDTAGAYVPVFTRGAEGDVFQPELRVALRDSPEGVSLTLYPSTLVPEPRTYGLMLAGLCLVAGLARRRRPAAIAYAGPGLRGEHR